MQRHGKHRRVLTYITPSDTSGPESSSCASMASLCPAQRALPEIAGARCVRLHSTRSLLPQKHSRQQDSLAQPTHKQIVVLKRDCKRRCVAAQAQAVQSHVQPLETQVLAQLERIIDPDFGMSVVACGFIKDMAIDAAAGQVSFRMQLTTPACPIKDEFERKARAYVETLEWVRQVEVTMDAQPPRPLVADDRPPGLQKVAHVIAVSSCKGGVGKSTTAVNLAYTLAQMGAKVGIFDADVFGPSLPTMVSPEVKVLQMDPETRAIKPTEYEGVKLVSFGYAGQGSAIMRGPMVSGVIQQLASADWGELDYLVVDFPPGTGDIQLTLCQTIAFSAAVIVTTPQKLAFIDVAKGVRMFARLAVPCVAVVENMSYFEADGQRYFPFGKGSGQRVVKDFGLPNLFQFPIEEHLSAAGDGGQPLVVSDPMSSTSQAFMNLGAAVVQEVAKLKLAPRNSVRYDAAQHAFVASIGSEQLLLDPATVRRNDTSAKSINEWTGEKMSRDSDTPEDIKPESVAALGNYAVQILWQDGFNQVAPFELLLSIPRKQPGSLPSGNGASGSNGSNGAQQQPQEVTGARQILQAAQQYQPTA